MMENNLLPWLEPGWLETATTWIDEQLARHNRQRTGDVEIVHQRPWSAFARVPTNQGIVYFKAPGPATAYEAPLAEALSRWRPDCIPPVLAIDRDRGWLLTADAGVTLRSLGQTPEQLDHWQVVLPLYAGLQQEMAGRVPELLAFGMPDRRLAHFPRLYDQLLQDRENLRIGLDHGLTADEHRRLLDLCPQVATLSQELAAAGLPETIAHEEVHENNVIYGDGRYSFTDWSDSSIAHPFFTMLVTLRSIAHWLKPAAQQAQLDQLRDLYLEHWTAYASPAELSEAFAIATRLAMINRSLSYYDTFAPLPQKYKIEYDGIPGWLQDYLAAEEDHSSPKEKEV